MSSYLTADGGLRDRLVLEDSQSGFAGVTSDVWTIETDGSFTIERLLDGKAVAPSRSGTLTAEQIEAIAAAMAAEDFGSLPAEAGPGDEINSRTVTLAFGDQASVLRLPAGDDMKQAACSEDRSRGLREGAAVAAAIVDALGPLDGAPGPSPERRPCDRP